MDTMAWQSRLNERHVMSPLVSFCVMELMRAALIMMSRLHGNCFPGQVWGGHWGTKTTWGDHPGLQAHRKGGRKGRVLAHIWPHYDWDNIDGLVQERHNSIAIALEFRLSCSNPSIYIVYHIYLTIVTTGVGCCILTHTWPLSLINQLLAPFLWRAMNCGTRITGQLRQPTTSLHTWTITWDIKGCLCLFKHHSPKHTPDW